MRGGGSGAILEALAMPLGSVITLFIPPGLAGPGGIPLIGMFPMPASPAILAYEAAGAASSRAVHMIFAEVLDMDETPIVLEDVGCDVGLPVREHH